VGVQPGQAFAAALARPVLAWDIDGTLAFAGEAVCTALNARFGTHYRAATEPAPQMKGYLTAEQHAWLHGQRADIAANMAPDLDALRVLRAARRAEHTTILCSARHEALRQVTIDWLNQWRAPYDQLLLTGDASGKIAALAPYGPDRPAVLLDNDPAYQIAVPRPGVEVWAPRRSYTPSVPRTGVWVFDDWGEVADRLGVPF
jgi:uncharacterized HAD superfamily protein